ncbi:MAG: RidA family protein [Sandaracinus sp.]|nr:RidA family protein [Sandaracinus sp.]MCB9616566.1 RidA family protein [Sandaracinus sp.]MCB9622494.1 RidA family protein [Sandaracinus sp.]
MSIRAREAAALAEAFAVLLERPRVHVLFEPPAAGRIAFGGELVAGPARTRHATAARWEPLYGYSRAVRVGDTIWVTGTVALSASGEPVGLEDAGAQTARCLAIVGEALEALGGSLRDVVRTRLFVTNIARDHDAVGLAHAAVFGDVRPATTMVEVRALIAEWMLVEVEADAQLGG